MQPASIQHAGLLARLIGIDKLIGKAKLHAEIEACLFLCKEGIRSGFSHNLADPMCDDLSSPGCISFEDDASKGETNLCRLLLK